MNAATPLLVIGYGNELRGDDGVGPTVAKIVAGWNLKDVRAIICPLLTPELADPISTAGTTVFVDAAVGGAGKVQLTKLEPHDSCQIMAHAADPRTMLALARDVFGYSPDAWWLQIPITNLEFGRKFSAQAEQGVAEAVEMLRTLCASRRNN